MGRSRNDRLADGSGKKLSSCHFYMTEFDPGALQPDVDPGLSRKRVAEDGEEELDPQVAHRLKALKG